MKKHRITAMLTGAAMLVWGMCGSFPFTAAAIVQPVGDISWTAGTAGTGAVQYEQKDGIHTVTIENPGGASAGGGDFWDCDFTLRDLPIDGDGVYRLTYSVRASNAGLLYHQIGIENDEEPFVFWNGNGTVLDMGDYHHMDSTDLEKTLHDAPQAGRWNTFELMNNQSVSVPANEWTTCAYEFSAEDARPYAVTGDPLPKPDHTDEAIWRFCFGGEGPDNTDKPCFPAGTVLEFDNLCLLKLDTISAESDQWHLVTGNSGDALYETDEDGIHKITIQNPGGVSNGGSDRFDLSFSAMTDGEGLGWMPVWVSPDVKNTYRIMYSVRASNEGTLYQQIQDVHEKHLIYWNGHGKRLDVGEYKHYDHKYGRQALRRDLFRAEPVGDEIPYSSWENQAVSVPANEWVTFAYEFTTDWNGISEEMAKFGNTLKDENEESVWRFHFGGDGEMTPQACFPAGTVLEFDNLYLECIPTIQDGLMFALTDFEQQTCDLIGYIGTDTQIKVPSVVPNESGEMTVTKITGNAFSDLPDVTSIELPDSLRVIDYNAFEHCDGITSLVIPVGVEIIEPGAFNECEKLETISLPETLTSLGQYAFGDCPALRSVRIPDSVKTLGDGVLNGCAFLEEAVLPAGLTEIPAGTFEGCAKLTEITVPSGVKTVGDWAFSATGLSDVTLPDGVTSLGECAFSSNAGLRFVTVPASVSEIAENCFDLSERVTIRGYSGSYAEQFAKEHEIAFVSLGSVPEVTEPATTETTVTTESAATTETTESAATAGSTASTKTTESITTTESTASTQTTTTATTETTPSTTVNSRFIWGEDNWSFNNDGAAFNEFHARNGRSYYISDSVMEEMTRELHLGNKDIEEYSNRFAAMFGTGTSSTWGGSCYGMTVSALMVKYGLLDLTSFGGEKVIHENSNTDEMLSVINYIQVMQGSSRFSQAVRENAVLSDSRVYDQQSFIKKLTDALTYDDYPVKLHVKIMEINPDTGERRSMVHAVLAYGVEALAEPYRNAITGGTYTKRILIADPNRLAQNQVYDDACLYYDPEDYSWVIPDWTKDYSNVKYRCCYDASLEENNGRIESIIRYTPAGAEVNVVNNKSPEYYRPGLQVMTRTQEEPGCEMVRGNDSTAYAMDNTSGSNPTNVAKYSLADVSGSSAENEDLFAFFNPKSAYKLYYKTLSSAELQMDYEDLLYTADVTNIYSVLFKPSGEITLTGSNANYDVSITANDEICVTDWYYVGVKGKKTDTLSFYKENSEKGYVLNAENLNNVTVTARNKDVTAKRTFSTEYDSVLIYEIDENTIGIKVDTDGDGEFDTELPTPEAGSRAIGDVDGDGSINAKDATAVLIAAAKIGTLGQTGMTPEQDQAADVNHDDVINALDANAILRYAAAIGTGKDVTIDDFT